MVPDAAVAAGTATYPVSEEEYDDDDHDDDDHDDGDDYEEVWQSVIVNWDEDRGFGFIRNPYEDGNDLFFHITDWCEDNQSTPADEVENEVQFYIRDSPKGPRACCVIDKYSDKWDANPHG